MYIFFQVTPGAVNVQPNIFFQFGINRENHRGAQTANKSDGKAAEQEVGKVTISQANCNCFI